MLEFLLIVVLLVIIANALWVGVLFGAATLAGAGALIESAVEYVKELMRTR